MIFGFLDGPLGDLVSSGVEAFRFTAAFLGGMLNRVVVDRYALARVRVNVWRSG